MILAACLSLVTNAVKDDGPSRSEGERNERPLDISDLSASVSRLSMTEGTRGSTTIQERPVPWGAVSNLVAIGIMIISLGFVMGVPVYVHQCPPNCTPETFLRFVQRDCHI